MTFMFRDPRWTTHAAVCDYIHSPHPPARLASLTQLRHMRLLQQSTLATTITCALHPGHASPYWTRGGPGWPDSGTLEGAGAVVADGPDSGAHMGTGTVGPAVGAGSPDIGAFKGVGLVAAGAADVHRPHTGMSAADDDLAGVGKMYAFVTFSPLKSTFVFDLIPPGAKGKSVALPGPKTSPRNAATAGCAEARSNTPAPDESRPVASAPASWSIFTTAR